MNSLEKLTNFRDAKCCYNCKHFAPDYDGDGHCMLYGDHGLPTNWKDAIRTYWTGLCDNFKEEEPW